MTRGRLQFALSLPEPERTEAIHHLVNEALPAISVTELREIRSKVAALEGIPICDSMLDHIDGHLALREINAS